MSQTVTLGKSHISETVMLDLKPRRLSDIASDERTFRYVCRKAVACTVLSKSQMRKRQKNLVRRISAVAKEANRVFCKIAEAQNRKLQQK